MKYIVTGVHGFIAGWIISHIEQQGHTVVPIPREMLTSKGLKAFLHSQKPDYIVHTAAYGNMSHQTDEQKIFDANVLGTWNLLQSSVEVPYRGFINISSSSVYGQKFRPMNEHDSLNTDSFYGASKVAGEYFVRAFVKRYDRPIVNVRPFSVYGEGEAEYRFIPTIIKSIVTGEEMTLATAPPHDWIHVDDFSRLTLELLNHVDILKGESVNIGTGKQTENGDVVAMLEEISGKRVNITKTVEGNNHEWVCGKSVLSEWKLEPRIELYEGLKRCWKFYKEQYGK